jgi:hypothetical protein
LLNVKIGKFLLALSFWVSFIARDVGVGVVAIAIAKGSLCYYTSVNIQS